MHEPADLADPSRHLEAIWRALAEAAASPGSPLRTPTLATVAADGSAQARTVVVRSAAPPELTLHTDARSPKVEQLRRDPRAALSFWDPERQVQIRAVGRCERELDADAIAEAWKQVPASNRLNYRTALPPGSPVPSADAVDHADGDGGEQFALLIFTVDELDWLWLDRGGHKRCRFDLRGLQATRQWLVP